MSAGAVAPLDARAGRSPPRPVTHRQVVLIALPVALSNAVSPLQGAIDTAVIGNLGEATSLAAVGLGAEIFALVFVSFNFLQFGLSGLSAQALGAGRADGLIDTLARGGAIAAAIACLLLLLQAPLKLGALAIFEASDAAEGLAGAYFDIRIWAAPAELGNFAIAGWFAGQAMTRRLLQQQLMITGVNVALSLAFVLGFGWGVPGVALATTIAVYVGLGYGLWLARGRIAVLAPAGWRPQAARIFERAALMRMLTLNRDLLIRTMLLLAAFAWMTRLGSQLGDAVLAANVVLFQFFVIAAAALDGFAMAAESLVGQAVGAGRRAAFDRAARLTTLWSAGFAGVLALFFVAIGGAVIDLFTTAPEVRLLAREVAYWAWLIPLPAFLAFQLDGIFIGATGSSQMRNAMILASAVYLASSLALFASFANHGVWGAIWIWLVARALLLMLFYPGLRRRIAQ